MTTPSALDVDALFERHLADHGEILEALEEVHDRAWGAADPGLLELCRVRVATLLGVDTEPDLGVVDRGRAEALAVWPSSLVFSDVERICLEFTEQWVINVASITDDQAGALVDALGPEAAMDFVNALLVVEQRLRLASMWSTLFPEEADDD